jgi:hypothetical protein
VINLIQCKAEGMNTSLSSILQAKIPLGIMVLLLNIFAGAQGTAQTIEFKDGFYHLDGEKFFVKGIGYEVGAMPGQLPWTHVFDPDQIRFDMRRILSGGYNTIRTWEAFTNAELQVLQEFDIKIIMGIWIDPHADFSDPSFVAQATQRVTEVLNYSNNYDQIIGYIIMNEPLPETISNAGYDATTQLWEELIQIIHDNHPGRPVSIANTCNGTYIDSNIFDFSAFNVYIYNPVTVNYLHGYADYVRFLGQLNQSNGPLIITEFGLSVSPSGPGNWGYGGNTEGEQQAGVLHMYRSLVNGGAAGSCVFNYSDGWWKGGNEWVHDDAAEEWFGLVGYAQLGDKEGTVRPVWNAIRDFQSAIITQPQDGSIYSATVPLEIFASDTIQSVEVVLGKEIVFQRTGSGHMTGNLVINYQETEEVALLFRCKNSLGQIIKEETKSLLIAVDEPNLPQLEISIENATPWDDGYINVNYRILKSDGFLITSNFEHIYYPHVGFDYGFSFEQALSDQNEIVVNQRHYITPDVEVFTVGGAFDVAYGSFQYRVVEQLTLSRINEIPSGVGADKPMSSIRVYPNPVVDELIIEADETAIAVYVYNSIGTMVDKVLLTASALKYKMNAYPDGIYFFIINGRCFKIIKS